MTPLPGSRTRPFRLAIVASHPVQYYAPIFRALARRVELKVFYAHCATPADQARAGFGIGFDWDVDLHEGYDFEYLENAAKVPKLGTFNGVDTPGIGHRLRDGGFDAALVLGWFLKSFVQAIVAARRAGIPVMVRGDSQLETPRSAIKRLAKEIAYPILLRQFAAALAVGARNRSYWEHYRYPVSQIFSSPHCIDTHWFGQRATPEAGATLRTSLGVDDNTRLALFAGKLVAFKRPVDVVEAAARLRKSGQAIELMVAGSGALEGEVRSRAAQLGVPVHMLGFCNQSQMPSAYAAADALVLPSDARETWGLVTNEALASGCPVVLSDAVGCAPDLAIVTGAARTYPLGDIEACSAAMASAFALPDARRNALELSAKFSIDAAVVGILRALEHVVRV